MHPTNELFNAVNREDISLIQYLLSQGALVNAKNQDGQTVLHEAVFGGNQQIVRLLLDKKAEVNAKNIVDDTPLHVAAYKGNQAVAKLLLERGAEISPRSGMEDTPLHLAAHRGNHAVVKLLLDRGAKINLRNQTRDTALHLGAYRGSPEVVQLLLDRSAMVNARNEEKDTPLHYSALGGCKNGDYQAVIALLLDRGAMIDPRNDFKKTPLHLAASNSDQTVVEILLNSRARINVQDRQGDTPLHLAAYREDQQIVRLLLDKGAKVNIKNKEEDTALCKAAQQGNIRSIRVLLEKGAYSYYNGYNDYLVTQFFNWQKLRQSWDNSVIDEKEMEAFYASLFVTGVNIKDQVLPESIKAIKKPVEAMVQSWLQPLNLPQAECQRITSNVLRALPRLNHWLSVINTMDKKREKDSDQLKSPEFYNNREEQMIGLKHFFLISRIEQDHQRLMLKELQTQNVPMEVLGLIREQLIVRVLADTLVKIYALPYRVANYLASGAMACPEAYCSFHERLFRDNLETICVPYTTAQTIQNTYASCSIRLR